MSKGIIRYGRYMSGGQTSAMVVSAEGISPCVLENHGKVTAIVEDSMKVNELGFYDSGTGKHQSNTVYDTNGIIPALTTIQGGGTQQIYGRARS